MNLGLGLGISFCTTKQAPSFVYLIDEVGATPFLAYSLRKLKSDYFGPCIQIYRNSDSSTLDIGFLDEIVDTASIVTFLDGEPGFISIWYDQSGSGLNLITVDQANMPLFDGTNVASNGKFSFLFQGLQNLYTENPGSGLSTNYSTQVVSEMSSPLSSSQFLVYGFPEGSSDFYIEATASGWEVFGGSPPPVNGSSITTDVPYLTQLDVLDDIEEGFYVNGNLDISDSFGNAELRDIKIGSDLVNLNGLNGFIQEVVIWPALDETQRNVSSENIKNYYGI